MAQERRKGGRRRSDRRSAADKQPAAEKPVLTNEQRTGVVQHDDRGDARWVFPSERQAQEALDRTFDELKALENEALSLLEQAPSRSGSPPGGGYNPYDVTAAPKKPTTRKVRR